MATGIINTALSTTQDPSSSPAPASSPPNIATANDVSASYNTLFGRPAEAAAIPFWTDYAQKNNLTSQQLHDKIASSAQGDDTSAQSSLSGGGSLASNWTAPGLNTADVGRADRWDSATNQWVPKTTSALNAQAPVTSSNTAAQLGDPTKWNVTPEQTVEGRVNGIIDKDSPIIQAARTRAGQASNARGLLNSSMGVEAGESAAYDAALPIASVDAQTSAKAAGYNADASNQFAVKNVDAQNTLNGQKLAADTQRYTASLDAQTRTALANLDSSTKLQLTQLDGQNKQLLQTNSSAANMFSTYMNSIASISQSTNMDQAAKDTATQNAIKNLNQGLQVMQEVSGADISKYFVPESYTPVTNVPSTSAVPDFGTLFNATDGGR